MTKTPKGAVAAGHEITAAAAAEILDDGGNAFDAVLAGLFAACTPETVLASIGGGGFLMAHAAAHGRDILYDFFAQTPRAKRPAGEIDFHAIDADFGPATQEFHIGAGAAATPGFVPGAFAIHGDLGRLPMRRILEPAIRAARHGIEMTSFQAYLFKVISPILTASDTARQLHAPTGALLKAGETFANPQLAETLQWLGEDGVRLFTEGDAARAVIEQCSELGGHLHLEDLKDYRVERRQPLAWRHHNTDFSLNPAPASGGALLAFSLGLAEALHKNGAPGALDLARIMMETNAARGAHAHALDKLADRAVVETHLRQSAAHLSSPRGTTHISVIDAKGNAAAATVSNGEGNGHMVGNFGFMLNNMLGEEDINPKGFHSWTPDQRLSSMMAPTILRQPDGALTALGSGGSNRIRTALLQVAVNLIDRGLPLEEAVSAPRLHVEKSGHLSFEDRFGPLDREALTDAFPGADAWPEPNMFFGGVHSVRRPGRGGFEAAGDPRRGGAAVVV